MGLYNALHVILSSLFNLNEWVEVRKGLSYFFEVIGNVEEILNRLRMQE